MSLTSCIRNGTERYIELTRLLVEAESPTHDVELCAKLAEMLVRWARQNGADVELQHAANCGPHVIARWPGEGPATLVAMHYDTVWPAGTLVERPFVSNNDVVSGPGSLDMKGGIAAFMLAMEASLELGVPLSGPVTALFTSDEETGSETSRELLAREARMHDRCFCMEPGADPFQLRMERKGVGSYNAYFSGIASHAGNAPEKGASAILELSRFALFTDSLNDPTAGVSVTVGRTSGGSAGNVVPAEATAELDVRVWNEKQARLIDRALQEYVPADSRVGFRLDGGMNRPPLEFTDGNRALFESARHAAALLGRDLGRAAVGGGSDGSITSAAGCPTIDGMGSCGDGPHTTFEHIRVSDSLDKVALLASLLTSSS